MYEDRRQHPRFPILLVAMAHTSNASFEAVCTNVSAGGAFLASRQAVAPGTPLELEIKPHGPEGPTVMLMAVVRYVVPKGSTTQPGIAVAWTEAACATSRLALEQVLRDILRVPRFRVTADGLGGRFRFGVPVLDDGPEPPAQVVFPPEPAPAPVAPVAAWPEPKAQPVAAAPVETEFAPDPHHLAPDQSGLAPDMFSSDVFDSLGADHDVHRPVALDTEDAWTGFGVPAATPPAAAAPSPATDAGPVDDPFAAFAASAPAAPLDAVGADDVDWSAGLSDAAQADAPASADAPKAAEPATDASAYDLSGYENETLELSVALAAALASQVQGAVDVQAEIAAAPDPAPAEELVSRAPIALPAAPVEPEPAFSWSDFDVAPAAPVVDPPAPSPAYTGDADDPFDAPTIDVEAARHLVLPSGVVAPEPVAVPATPVPDDDDFDFTAAATGPAVLRESDEFPETLPEPPPPAHRMTRSSVIRRLSGSVDPSVSTAPRAARPIAVAPTETMSRGDETLAYAQQPVEPSPTTRPTSTLTRSFLSKVATGEFRTQRPADRVSGPTPTVTIAPAQLQQVAAAAERASQPVLNSATATYADHDPAAHRAAINRQTDDLHVQPFAEPDPMPLRASQPRPVPPSVSAEPRPNKPVEMVDAGHEVPRVMTESTVAYARESASIGPLQHAQTWPVEGGWPESIPPSLSERYGYLEHIGTGGHGVAFRAVDLHLNRLVVLKFLAQSTMSTELARKYFLREVKLAASLNHPNIVHIYDIGKVDDVLFYAMEYVDGVPLSAYLPLREPLRDWQFVYAVMVQLCEALDHAHNQQILHRDVKPENVLVAADGVVKLFDFGLARVADEGFGEQSVLIGTPHYMAPEQLMGQRVDHRTDIYALGVMLFRMVTGVLPFQDGNVFAAHATEPVPDARMFNPALPYGVVAIIERAMAKQPANRYNSAREVAAELYVALFGAPLI